jgi:hypothetical protein
MELTLLTVPACPNAAAFEQRLAAALAGHPGVALHRREVSDEREAAQAGMHGSPTLLIGGTDPFAGPDEPPSLSCRMSRPACRAGCTGTRRGTRAGRHRCTRSGRRSRRPAMADPDAGTAAGTPGLLTRGGGKRAGQAAGPRAVHQAVLQGFASTGRPPAPAELEDAARLDGITARQALAEFSGADVLDLDIGKDADLFVVTDRLGRDARPVRQVTDTHVRLP